MKLLLGVLGLAVLLVGGFLFNQNVAPDSAEPTIETAPSRALDLSHQNLTKVPDSVFKNTAVEELDLSHNQLTGALQAEVRMLQRLKRLDLSDNQFTGVPAEVGQLVNLEVLDLSNNRLTGLPHELGNFSKLQVLDLSGNDYSEHDLSIIREALPRSTVIHL